MTVFSPILLPFPFIIILTSINAAKKKGWGIGYSADRKTLNRINTYIIKRQRLNTGKDRFQS